VACCRMTTKSKLLKIVRNLTYHCDVDVHVDVVVISSSLYFIVVFGQYERLIQIVDYQCSFLLTLTI